MGKAKNSHAIIPMTNTEYVVLVDEENNVLGTMPKAEVHTAKTPRHRAFSSFIFNAKGELLLQQRAKSKKTWPLVWSNSCCGHPTLEESPVQAAHRRLSFELGLDVPNLEEMAPYRYCFTRDGVMENEICPIVVGRTDVQPNPNPDEVEAIRWIPWQAFVDEIRAHPQDWSEWCAEEVEILAASERFKKWML
jgi:isopentenyl-diphosphate delta-isomerase